MAQVGAPAVGELLADRYRLDEHINDDSTGRQVWRGTDVLLARPVTVVLRTPGGDEAQEMLTAAVAASRVNHAHIVGVYDAVDEGDRAYIVREWVEGRSLRDIVIHSPLDPRHAISLSLAVAEAITAVHASGVAHGNVHPGTVLLSDDDRVVLSDPRGGAAATQTGDVRAIGATLYCALTGLWPREVPGPAVLPDAPRDESGRILPAALANPGVPSYLDRLTTELLDPAESPPTAAELVEELAQIEGTEGTDALDFVAVPDSSPEGAISRPVGKRFVYGIAGMVVVALLALLLVTQLLPDGDPADGNPAQPGPDTSASENVTAAQELRLSASQLRLIMPETDSDQKEDFDKTVDGDTKTGWNTVWYKAANFGNLSNKQPGMGLLIDLGEEREVTQVIVHLGQTGNEISLRSGTDASGDGKAIIEGFQVLDGPKTNGNATVRFAPNPGTKTRYLMVFLTKLGPKGDGNFMCTINEISVYAS